MIRTIAVLLLSFAGLALAGEQAPPSNGWRGDGTGIHTQAAPPSEWSAEKHIAWKTEVGWSYSSPIAIGDKVVVTSEPNLVACLNIADGKLLWEKEIKPNLLPEALRGKVENYFDEETSGNTAPTPFSDGKHVFLVFGNGMVVGLTLEKGETKWARHIDLAPTSGEGRSASPLLADGKLIVHLSELMALDPASGKTLWSQPDAVDGYGSPVAGKIGQDTVVATPKGDIVRVSDGKVLAKELGDLSFASPVIQDGVLYMIGSNCSAYQLPDKIEGDKITPKKIWSEELMDEVYSSPAIVDGRIYALPASAKLIVFDMKAKTKTTVATGLDKGDEEINLYASVAVFGKHLYLFNNRGVGSVFELGAKPVLLKTNKLSAGAAATPTAAGKRLFLRSGESIYCIKE